MLNSEQRRAQILQALQSQDSVRVTRLAQRLGVSSVTIRTDLRALTEAGLLTRQHGGARLSHVAPPEAPLAEKRQLHRERKLRIAACAAALVAPGDKLILDAGSTTLNLARLLHASGPFTVFTNSLPIASELANAEAVELIVSGGALRKASQSLQGAQAEASLQGYVFDKLFLGVDGFDCEFGLSTHDAAEARLNAHMIEHARRVIVLADSSKFGQLCLHRICHTDRVHAVVSDAALPPLVRAALEQQGIEVIIATEHPHAS